MKKECFVWGLPEEEAVHFKPISQLFAELAKSGAAFKFSAIDGRALVQVDGLAASLTR